jgi:hypothetical protein
MREEKIKKKIAPEDFNLLFLRFVIERTTSPPGERTQIRGDFVTEEERIANLFAIKTNGRSKKK